MKLDILSHDLRSVDTEHAISVLRKYLEVMEAQMEEVHRCERVVLDGERPETDDEEDYQVFLQEKQALDELFERDLAPAMRYSFIVLTHTVFETRLRAFCSEMQRDLKIPVLVTEIRGSPIDQARTYLTKLARLGVANFPEWNELRNIQIVRECIVHVYGFVAVSGEPKALRQLVNQNAGLTIDDNGRLVLSKSFCDEYLSCLARFFERLFRAAGWKR